MTKIYFTIRTNQIIMIYTIFATCLFLQIYLIMNAFSIWEILMLLCFACSWPVSIIKSLRTKIVAGKSPFFMSIIMLGYLCGIMNKLVYRFDVVIYLYVFNLFIVSVDLFLYFYYGGNKSKKLINNSLK